MEKNRLLLQQHQTNQKPQPTPETNLQKQPEKMRVHPKTFNNNQKEDLKSIVANEATQDRHYRF
jgi:hypothetical protein